MWHRDAAVAIPRTLRGCGQTKYFGSFETSSLLRVARKVSALAIDVYIWTCFLSRGIRVTVLQRGVDAMCFSVLRIKQSNGTFIVPLLFPGSMQ